MTIVFIAPKNYERDILPLFSLLNLNGKASAAAFSKTDMRSNSDWLLLPLKGNCITSEDNCAAVIFKNCEAVKNLPKNCSVLCFDQSAAAACSNGTRQIISCGMGRKDTITLSSLENDRPVLSLQRKIYSFSGNLIEPEDFPLFTDQKNYKAIMAAAALMLLCGKTLSPDVFSNQSSTVVPLPFSK